MKRMRKFLLVLLLFLISIVPSRARTPDLGTNQVWRFTLLTGLAFFEDCEICGGPTFLLPMQGTFDFSFLGTTNWYDYFAITNIDFSFTDQNGTASHISGRGTCTVGGDFALQEWVNLELTLSNGTTNQAISMTNSSKGYFKCLALPALRSSRGNRILHSRL